MAFLASERRGRERERVCLGVYIYVCMHRYVCMRIFVYACVFVYASMSPRLAEGEGVWGGVGGWRESH